MEALLELEEGMDGMLLDDDDEDDGIEGMLLDDEEDEEDEEDGIEGIELWEDCCCWLDSQPASMRAVVLIRSRCLAVDLFILYTLWRITSISPRPVFGKIY